MCSVRILSEIFGRINRITPVPQYPFTAGCNLATPCKIGAGTCALLWILWRFFRSVFYKTLESWSGSEQLHLNNTEIVVWTVSKYRSFFTSVLSTCF